MNKGRDIVGIAQTGTGKTASFVLPLLHDICQNNRRPAPKSCKALILAPTRELAAQISEGIQAYGQFLRFLSNATVVGGVKAGPQVKAMAKGVDILVATPGRLEDLVSTGAIRLDHTVRVVLDEADQMLDLGFMPAIRRIMNMLPAKRQTVLMSATMPKQIRALAQDFLSNPLEISVAPQSKPIDRIDQSVIHLTKAEKRQKLVDVLKEADLDRAVVFTRTKHGANKVSQHLEKAGLKSGAIHGNKSQNQRLRTLADFKSGALKILVATDIAARGIDVDGVSHVVNFELPNVPEVYVHRIGRTARAGNSGVAISLCDETEQGLLKDIEKLIGQSISASGDMPPAAPAAKPAKSGRGSQTRRRTGQGGSRRNSHSQDGQKQATQRQSGQSQSDKDQASQRGQAGQKQSDRKRSDQRRSDQNRSDQKRSGPTRAGETVKSQKSSAKPATGQQKRRRRNNQTNKPARAQSQSAADTAGLNRILNAGRPRTKVSA